MSLKKMAFRGLNRALSLANLKLERTVLDFQDVFLDDYTRKRVVSALAESYKEWVANQGVIEVQADFDVQAFVAEFLDAWLKSPFRQRGGGSRLNNLLWLALVTRSYGPDLIVDSGTFQGASAWAMHIASPRTPLYSFDIDHGPLRLRCDLPVRYVERDWMMEDLPQVARTLAYFDDHLDQVMRLKQAIKRDVDIAIFDDDFPITSYFAMAPGPHVLPKIEFVLDDDLQDGMVLRWRSGGREHSWQVDRGYLDSVKPHIAASGRIPNTSHITGIHQTPYRLVAIAP